MKRVALVLLLALPLLAQQTTPPAPAAPREVKLPQPVEKRLGNGLRVIVVSKHSTPLVAARLMIRSGSAADPKGRDGLAQLAAQVLTKGTKTRSAEQIARDVEALGATLQSNAEWDSTSIDLSVMSSNLAGAMASVADVARNATFAVDEVELARAQTLDSLQVTLEQPASVAALVAGRLLFGEEPYGHSAAGTPQSMARITRDDLIAFHRTHYRPENAVLVLAGDVKPDDAFALAQNLFGTWAKGSAAKPAQASAAVAAKPRVVVIDMPGAGQAAVRVGLRGISRNDPAYYRALVANSVLGGSYSARLNQEIRIRRGLSYGAFSSFQPRQSQGPFSANTQTKNESAAEVVGLIVAQMAGLAAQDVPAAELVPRKAVLIGEFAQSLETTAGIVGNVSALALYNLPLGDINRFIGGVESVTAEQVRQFAGAKMPGQGATIVIAGDAKQFADALSKQYERVETIPITDLDLNSPTLRVRKAKN